MSIKLSDIKSWTPEIEAQITKEWKKKGHPFNPKTKKKIYSIDTPPPYVNTPIHMGHAVTYSYMDFFARHKRLKGYEVLFPLGLDRNGLPIEMATEKKFNITPDKVGREKFIEHCKKLLEEASEESLDAFAKLGISFNSFKKGNKIGEIYETDSEEYRKLTQETFIDLYKKGLVYEDIRINNWDPKLRTTISDSEIDYLELPSTFNHVKWKIKETGESITIATTRPELICTCGAVIFNPKDERYKNLEGKTAISPIYEKEIPIISNPLANPDKGTGIVMICGGGDLMDNQFFREMGMKPKIAIGIDGKMNELSGILKGLKVKEAREKILEILKENKLLVKQEQITHRTPISERSKAEVEFIEMPEYYLKQLEHLDNLRNIINQITFFPEESKEILERWISSIAIDWPISRRRYYATPIPLWFSEDGKYIAIPPKGKYYEPYKQTPPLDSDIHEKNQYISLGKLKDKEFKKLKWKGEDRVFDTWFDSSISELFIIKYPSKESEKMFPVTIRTQGKEIVRTWLYYTLLRGYHEKNAPAFKEAWIHQHILDDKGKKMSKSLGNIIDPQEILKQEGAEALRLWSATEGDISKQDLSCSRERIKGEVKTINKLLNIAKFISQFKKPKKKPEITDTDQLFIDYTEALVEHTEENYEKYNFYHPSIKLRHFLWEILASHYLELVKSRAYNEQKIFSKEESESAHYTLNYLLERLIILLNPIIPQVTYLIADNFGIKIEKYPEKQRKMTDIPSIEKTMSFNSEVWKTKKENSISLKEQISGINIPKDLRPFEKDLRNAHNIQ